MRRWRKRLSVSLLALLLLASLGAAGWWWALRASLPQLDGNIELLGLEAPVSIARDAAGVAWIEAHSRVDAARASGFLHAQERFFQMDLMRRSAAGELAALFGAKAVGRDEKARLHGFRRHARREVAALDSAQRQLLDAYVDGVNQGLAALSLPPFEYLLLRTRPQRWQAADSVLVMFAMYLRLQAGGIQREADYGVMKALLPAALYRFLAPRGGRWDTPLIGGPIAAPPLPSAEVLDLRSMVGANPGLHIAEPPAATGSNSWAVAGRLTAAGGAMLANDMHLPLGVPNIWYRLGLRYPFAGEARQVVGVTLPGLPVMLSGSNGEVAWGFTNSYADTIDRVLLEAVPGEPDSYQSVAGPRRLSERTELIEVRGDEPRSRVFQDTIWGPLLPADALGERHALRWIAYDPGTLNLGLIALENAGSAVEALDIANISAAPAQNFIAADRDGHIGWTLVGPLPRRIGFDGRTPVSWADGSHRWDGWLPPNEYPRLVDPERGFLWSANNRLVGAEAARLLGDGGYLSGARARQIRDDIDALGDGIRESDLLAVQLDDRALFLQRWRELLLATLDGQVLEAHQRRRQARQMVLDWSGRASLDSVGYRLLREFRRQVAQRAFAPLLGGVTTVAPGFDYGAIRFREVPLWQLVAQRPQHLLASRYADWDALLIEALDASVQRLVGEAGSLQRATWGQRNTVRVQHPFSRLIPWLSRWLDMPVTELPGDTHMPRVQGRSFGASERLVVSPGREQQGIFQMPGGQSGHPLSSYYRTGFDDWASGHPAPLLPGELRHQLILLPVADASQISRRKPHRSPGSDW